VTVSCAVVPPVVPVATMVLEPVRSATPVHWKMWSGAAVAAMVPIVVPFTCSVTESMFE
jgi:hypothetical protein